MLETLRSYWSIISTIITVVAVPAIGYLYKKYKQADARQKAVELGVQALLRDRIVQSYYHYEERGWICRAENCGGALFSRRFVGRAQGKAAPV